MADTDEPLQVGDDVPIGSPRLAQALAAGDADAIGRALRLDVVLVPLVRGSDGTAQVRVLPTGEGLPELALFSSSTTLAHFLQDAPTREFDLQRGPQLADFLQAHRHDLGRVLFDPAGPHPVAAPVDAVIESLRPRRDDDEVAWIAGSGAPEPAGDVVADYRWAMPLRGWVRVVPDQLRSHPDAISGQLARVARRLPRVDREPVAAWIAATAVAEAQQNELREVAAIAEGRGDDALVILASRTWHLLGETPEGDFAAAVDRRAAALGPDDELVSSGDEFVSASVRHAYERPEPALAGGRAAVVDYLLAFPDGRGVCRLRFVTPQPERRAELIRATAAIVAGGQWITRARG